MVLETSKPSAVRKKHVVFKLQPRYAWNHLTLLKHFKKTHWIQRGWWWY